MVVDGWAATGARLSSWSQRTAPVLSTRANWKWPVPLKSLPATAIRPWCAITPGTALAAAERGAASPNATSIRRTSRILTDRIGGHPPSRPDVARHYPKLTSLAQAAPNPRLRSGFQDRIDANPLPTARPAAPAVAGRGRGCRSDAPDVAFAASSAAGPAQPV